MVGAPFLAAAALEAIGVAASPPSTAETLTVFTTVDSPATTDLITMADITAIPIMEDITGTVTTEDTLAIHGMEDLVSALVSARSGDLGAILTAIDIIPRPIRTTRMTLTAFLPPIPTIGTILPALRLTIATPVPPTQTITIFVTTVTRTRAAIRARSSGAAAHQT